ncbi:beta-ketoacyl-[acyl-carrier-protein] synthase family protein [Streptomyces sp. SCA3-4]|uniref:beta-ketoacyl-[acyl-carrier-protein] synthase family protein n=1 Tax=Streptomyces sichuanensis TaxID=2871810 RepID=UPI001CE37824|nr:beta-ketoacyl-[acyl-carrier-protein] synthase family protein [Streptomyces sichuanensis]MCA6091907.1 beta-ketoacyl-[acyl-carrier-protein] synthase family protein [Streptomyces sichuanensis]
MSAGDVAVTGMGLLTPAGTSPEATWEGLCRGVSTACFDPVLKGLPVDFSCRVPSFEAEPYTQRLSWRMHRFTYLAVAAAQMAVTDAGLDPDAWDGSRIGVVIGVGSASMEGWGPGFAKFAAGRPRAVSPLLLPRSIPNMAAGEIAMALGARGPNLAVSTACASGTTALGVAKDLLAAGRCDIVLAGGAEAPPQSAMAAVCFAQMTTLSSRRDDPARASRPFDADRDGFVLGEGAAVLVLENSAHARARGARCRALLAGFGASADAYHPTAPDPEGTGAALAMRAALTDAGLTPADIDHVNAHGSSTPSNDIAEATALRRLFGTPPPVTANKGVFGHALGGAGAIEAACSILSLEAQLIPPTANLDRIDPRIDLDVVSTRPRKHRMEAVLSNSFGFGGHNAAVVLVGCGTTAPGASSGHPPSPRGHTTS